MSARPRIDAFLVAVLCFVVTMHAAMSDPKALSEAKRLFGLMGGIATVRGQGDTYWTKQVGLNSPNCKAPFTVLGSGINTWEAAFFQVPAGVVKGPFAGAITLQQTAYDDKSVVSVKFVIDGVPAAERVTAPGQLVQVRWLWGTAELPNGVHTVCTVIVDSDGNVSRTPAWPVLLDQGMPSIGTGIKFDGVGGYPAVSGGS